MKEDNMEKDNKETNSLVAWLRKIREPKKTVSLTKKLLFSLLILLFGIAMGVGSKMLDTMAFNELPGFLQAIDIINLLGRLAIWIFIAVVISVYSNSPLRAALNTFLFFLGMVASYYVYSMLAAGFFPRSYAMIWFAITAVSPFLAFVCWYAKGKGWIAIVISGLILGVLFAQAILLFQGIRIANYPEVVIWIAAAVVLWRKPKEFLIELAICIATAVVYQLFIPYWG